MKKTILLLLLTAILLSFASCSMSNDPPINKFIELKNNETLYIGETQEQFMNYENVVETVETLTYPIAVTYTLQRSSVETPNSVSYKNQYYYWEEVAQTTTQTLGKSTETTTYKFSYLPYGENENVAIKATVYTSVSYDYEGGWIEKDVAVTCNLNGFFASTSTLQQACPALAEKINLRTTRQYYVDTTTPDNIWTEQEFYDSYYYIEEK